MAQKFSKRPGKDATKTAKEKWREYLKNETPQEKFNRLSKPVIYLAIKHLRRLERIVSSPLYETTTDQVNSISEILHEQVGRIQNAYNPNKTSGATKVDQAEILTNQIFGEEGN